MTRRDGRARASGPRPWRTIDTGSTFGSPRASAMAE